MNGIKAQQKPLKLLIIDDHTLVLDTLSKILSDGVNLKVDTAANVDAAIKKIEENGCYDVIFLDYNIPGNSGMEILRIISKANNGKVALFSGNVSWPIVQNAMKQGASGFIPKTISLKNLVHAINFIADGEIYLPYEYMQRLSGDDFDEFGLKPRELQVLAYLCEGMQNKEIGREVGIEEVIVKMDVKSICRKLGVRNRTEAALAARKIGLY